MKNAGCEKLQGSLTSYELAQVSNNFWHMAYIKHNVIWQYKK